MENVTLFPHFWIRLTARLGYINVRLRPVGLALRELMFFFRPTRSVLCALLLLFPIAARALREDESTNPVAELAKNIQHEKILLNYDDAHGYLEAVLKALNVPVSSQT